MADPPRSSSPPSLAPLSFNDDQPDVWARSSPSPSTEAPPAAVLSAVAAPLPSTYLADFDPYAPTEAEGTGAWSDQQSSNWTTLGATVQSSSRLEILPPEEDSPPSSAAAGTDQAFEQLPTSFQVEGQGGPPATVTAPKPPIKPTPSNLSASAASPSTAAPGGGAASFLGGVFRSISSSGSTPSSPTTSQAPATPSKAPPAPPRHSDPPFPQTHTEQPQAEQGSSLPKPLASIANVFRSPLGSRTSSSAGTPPSGSSPTNARGGGEKMAEAAAVRRASASGAGGKEKQREREREKEEKDKEEAQFDFNKFLEQMRSRSADPIAKYLRSFLKEFSRRPPISTADQIRVINDFLDFISAKMRSVDPWKGYFAPGGVGDKEGWSQERRELEFEVAGEAMEKLVMNRVWHLTFTPALDLSTLSSFPGQTSSTGDIERDAILSQRIKLFAWIKPSHLDLPIPDPSGEEEAGGDEGSRPATPKVGDLLGGGSEGSEKAVGDGEKVAEGEEMEQQKAKQRRQVQSFLDFARRELGKMNQYKAPRDKLICVLNCCKVIFGLIRSLSTKEEGADTFIPFLIYVVLKANPEHLVSNLQYIQRFRNPEKLQGEGGYYLSSLNGAISFIETVDASSLSNITQVEFETNVANAIRNLPQPDDSPRLTKAPQFPSPAPQPPSPNPSHRTRRSPDLSRTRPPTQQRPQVATNDPLPPADQAELESPSLLSQPALSFPTPSTAKGFLLRSTDSVERAMSKPLGAIGRIFDQLDQRVTEAGVGGRPPQMDQGGPPGQRRGRRFSGDPNAPQQQYQGGPPGPGQQQQQHSPHLQGMYAPEGSSAQEVSREIDRQHEEQRLASINTLKSVFPNLEDEVLEMVLLSNSGDMAKTIDALLEMS